MKVMLLFESTGLAASQFEALGIETVCVDLDKPEPAPMRQSLQWDILEREEELCEIARDCHLLFGMPPCTDLAGSGAGHFQRKAEADPDFQTRAVHLARSVARIGKAAGVPWALENPIGRLSTLWRRWDAMFNPWEYGGYLPNDDIHPLWPDFIAPRDAYPKKTCLWTGNGFVIPDRKPVEPEKGYSRQHLKLGGKGYLTKRIRSASPRGFFRAVAEGMK